MSIISEKIEGTLIEIEIKSSNLKSAKYDTQTQILEVKFNNNSTYQYESVPWKIFTKFRMAESQGRFFNTDISRNYSYKKIE